jgi:RNA polymerase sigma-70 factor (ECF subfamily)
MSALSATLTGILLPPATMDHDEGRGRAQDPDALLASRAAAGDQAAFRALVVQYRRRVFGVALRMLGDAAEADDLAQDVFVTLFRSLKGFRAESRLSTWIYRVTRNHCLNRIKYLDRRGRRSTVSSTGEEGQDVLERVRSADPGPGRLAQASEGTRRLEEALRALPVDQREVVVLREVEELSYEEIMAVTGLAEGTVKSRLHRARAALVAALPELAGGVDAGERS